jgi:hypothetical protein
VAFSHSQGHFQPEILKAATRLAAGLASKLTQIQPLVYRKFQPGIALPEVALAGRAAESGELFIKDQQIPEKIS